MSAVFDPSAFAERLEIAVGEFNTVPAAAASCGIPTPTLEAYLYSPTLPGARVLAMLVRGLGVSADWLLFGELAHG